VNQYLSCSADVRSALDAFGPVIALESTIISHGFPYPANVECAMECERIAREEGAVPATIAVIGGRLKVGLDESEIEYLASTPGIAKASRRDIPVLLAAGTDGATTVAGTMLVAALAGIRVFATGGIGGAHRGAEHSMDVSADLLELGRTELAVVCAGAKSVLDLGLTLEVLETHGVPVIGFQTDEFPAFYTRSSGHPVDWRLDSPAEIAAVLKVRRSLGIGGGTVVANPIPVHYALPPEDVESWTSTALSEAAASGVHGKAVTPFLLGRIHELSGGASEEANKQLVYNNVRLASRIARELATGQA
jgi:pseudouridine-5'-phosphate glycosidase